MDLLCDWLLELLLLNRGLLLCFNWGLAFLLFNFFSILLIMSCLSNWGLGCNSLLHWSGLGLGSGFAALASLSSGTGLALSSCGTLASLVGSSGSGSLLSNLLFTSTFVVVMCLALKLSLFLPIDLHVSIIFCLFLIRPGLVLNLLLVSECLPLLTHSLNYIFVIKLWSLIL